MIIVIGDVHGCLYTLQELVKKVNKLYPSAPVYCVGDLIDRGNFSFEVIEFVKNEGIKFTPGNHDYMFYYFIKKPASNMGASWIYNGFEKTISSYDNRFEKIPEHLDFISEAPLFYDLAECFISHAGISGYYNSILGPDPLNDIRKLDEEIKKDISNEHGILWTRDDLMNLGKLQIVGHTRKQDITYQSWNKTVYIDTSIYTGNKLSAIVVEEGEIMAKHSV
ncbi:MAG TPA: metallophosphoesterase, partial [Ignavibacteriaceae bacterium]|nr:metallophosphoesterase [Ignavibacteriaceae bacterium]